MIADANSYAANPALGHPNEDAFNDGALIAGRSCRDALRRVCEWHKARGDKGLKCDTAAMGVRELDRLSERLRQS